ncbi:long-chain fatty acid--CoA ligase [Mariniluteicoccus flavus]
MSVSHLGQMLASSVASHPDRPALRVSAGDDWSVTTYRELGTQVAALAGALVELGVEHGDRVALFSRNRPEWTVADLAVLSIGGVVVPIYQTSTARQARHILDDSGAKVVFVEGPDELAKVAEVRDRLPGLASVIAFEGDGDEQAGVTAYADLAAHVPSGDSRLEERLGAVEEGDVATIIYTSGTTGDPKGVVLTHRAFVTEVAAVLEFFDIDEHDHSLCFLPLAHAFERAWTFVVLSVGGMNTYHADAKTVAEAMPLVQPTMMVSVPRLFERVFAVANERAASSPIKKRVFDWAIATGRKAQAATAAGRRPNPLLAQQLKLADKLVLSGIRHAIGGPKKALAAGGAPLRKEVEEFFHAAGILVCQGYGLTETAPLISFNSPKAFKFGTVGRVMPGGEVKIADDGEILYRGPNVMVGYFHNDHATDETFTDDGWLRTGDIGELDDDGFLRITDRLKDLIVTEGGKNVAPGPIEGELAADPLIEYAVVLGDNRPCLTALVRPSLPDLETLAGQLQIQFAEARELVTHEKVIEEIKSRVARVSETLPSHEKIREVEVIDEDLTMDNGLLTPTLKVKRRAVEQKFAEKIEAMYDRVKNRKR